MNWFNRLVGGGSKPATTSSAQETQTVKPQGSPTSPENSPLKPAFERSQAKFKGQIESAMEESRDLAAGFKACLMEVGCANVKGAPTFYGYGTHKPMTMTINKAVPEGRLDLTVCMNVSGHDFKDANKNLLPGAQQMMEARAKDNKYVIQVTHPDGTIQKMTGIEAKGATSTAQDISIHGLKPGKTVVEAWPEGSAGVGGYVEGRRLEITYRPPGAAADSFG